MSEADDIQEFVKLVGKGKPKGVDWPTGSSRATMYTGWRDPRVTHTVYSDEAYLKWRIGHFPNVKYFFDPKTGMYGVHHANDPLKTDITTFILDKWDAYRRKR